jgi:two-component system, chemotaxis family, chemotaxis protein CheY
MDEAKKVKRILVVDDQENARKIIERLFVKYGHVDLAESGEQALMMFASALKDDWPYDLVCLDIIMPGLLGGDKALRGIRAHEGRVGVVNPVPVVMISTIDPRGLPELIDVCGADDYITKPFNREQIQAVVQKYLSC